MTSRYTGRPAVDPRYMARLARPQKPARPIRHEEFIPHLGERVIIEPSTRHLWPEKQWRILKHWFPETHIHRREERWSRRKHPIQPIQWEGAFGYQPPPRPPPPPPAPASA